MTWGHCLLQDIARVGNNNLDIFHLYTSPSFCGIIIPTFKMDHGRKLYVGNPVLDHSRDSVKYTYPSGLGRNEGFDECIQLL